jgi:transcription initiation factor TFIIF subunit alpha
VTTTKKELLEGFRNHVARLVAREDVDITDSQEYMRPVKLHRRDLTARPGQLQPGDADYKSEAEDANLARIEEAKLVRQRQRDENAKLIAPSAANKKKGFISKKKTEQVRRTNDTAEEQKRSQLRYEEALPWHLEDFLDKHTWVGAYEAALSDCHLMFVLEDDHFRVVPIEKWYKFREKSKFKTLDADQAEALLKKKVREPRWLMVHQKQDEMKKMIEKDAKRATGFFTRSGDKEEKPNIMGGAQREEPAPDADELDFNEDELFDDDEENPIFEGDEDEQKDAQNKIKREQRNANIFDLNDEKEIDEEEEREKMVAQLQKQLEKGTRKALLRHEKNYVYEDSDDGNPYTSGVRDPFYLVQQANPRQSDEHDSNAESDNSRKSGGDKARNNEPRSGQTTRGENTPSGRKKTAAAAGVKRAGSPLQSDASGNEATRKKPKLAIVSRPRSTAASPDASGASGTESGAAAKKRTKAKGVAAAAAAAPRGATSLSVRGGAGSGSDSDVRSVRLGGAGGKKGKSKAGTAASSARGTPAASRAQSPAAGAPGKASRSASPAASALPRKFFPGVFAESSADKLCVAVNLPSEEEIVAAIPVDGIDIAGLINAFRNRLPKARQKEFISLVRRVTDFNFTTKRIHRK